MHLRPCSNCPHRKGGCDLHTGWLAKLRGTGITLANFQCDKRLSDLPPGQRITLGVVRREDDDWDMMDYTAIVMRPKGKRILIWFDGEVPNGRNPICVRPDQVTPIEGIVSLCPECGQPEGTKGNEKRAGVVAWSCFKCAGYDSWQELGDAENEQHEREGRARKKEWEAANTKEAVRHDG